MIERGQLKKHEKSGSRKRAVRFFVNDRTFRFFVNDRTFWTGKTKGNMSSKENKAGKRIQMYRENHGWSIWDLSQKSGVEEKVINAIEKGEVMPALGVLVKLSRALGLRIGTFMDDQFKPDERPRLCKPLARARQARQAHGSVPHRICSRRR